MSSTDSLRVASSNDPKPEVINWREAGAPQLLPLALNDEIVPQLPGDDSDLLTPTPSNLSSNLVKLQTYLPTGTWVVFAALQTWAFSIRPNDAPTSAACNCNFHQRLALLVAISLSALFAFSSSFLKSYIYDAAGRKVICPPPNLFNVARSFQDPKTGVWFPCRTGERRYCWPLVDKTGKFFHDGERLRVVVFRIAVEIQVKRRAWVWRELSPFFEPEERAPLLPRPKVKRPWPTRVWSASFGLIMKEPIPAAPPLYMSTSTSSKSVPATLTLPESVGIDEYLSSAPALEPRRIHALWGIIGRKMYLDFRPHVWSHALVSVLTFLSLALFSPQVTGCIYPSIPDYLPSALQTAMLVFLGFIATAFVQDDAVSLGQSAPLRQLNVTGGLTQNAIHSQRPMGLTGPPNTTQTVSKEMVDEMPPYFPGITEILGWVER